jgi:hypothetical protein
VCGYQHQQRPAPAYVEIANSPTLRFFGDFSDRAQNDNLIFTPAAAGSYGRLGGRSSSWVVPCEGVGG